MKRSLSAWTVAGLTLVAGLASLALLRAQNGAAPEPAATPSFASTNPADFVQIHHGRFELHGQPFVLRGTNYFGSWLGDNTIPAGPDLVHFTVFKFYGAWNPQNIAADFRFLRTQLNATAVRIGTPSAVEFKTLVQYHGFQPWFNPDGSITDHSRRELIQLADLAVQNGLRIQLCLLWNVSSEIAANGDAFKPGGAMDTFYSHQVRSITNALRDHPGVMAYSIGNEVLVKWAINGTHRSWFEGRAGGFILRRIRDVRENAPHQLVTVDEGAGHFQPAYWHSPGPELALLPDVDDSNHHQSFRLKDQVDYHGGHFYPETLMPADIPGQVKAKLADADAQLKVYLKAAEADGKPVVLSETGLKIKPATIPPSLYAPVRDALMKQTLATGQALGLQGTLYWLALPMRVLRPGQFSVEPGPGKSHPEQVVEKKPDGQPLHIYYFDPHFPLFDWKATGDLPVPTPAARALAEAWPAIPPLVPPPPPAAP
jgi:hypothetical protein